MERVPVVDTHNGRRGPGNGLQWQPEIALAVVRVGQTDAKSVLDEPGERDAASRRSPFRQMQRPAVQIERRLHPRFVGPLGMAEPYHWQENMDSATRQLAVLPFAASALSRREGSRPA